MSVSAMIDDSEAVAGERRHFIGGRFTSGSSGKSFENISPVSGQVLGIVHEGGEAEVDAAVRAARKALDGDWGKLSLAARCDMLEAVADGINDRFDEFLEAECADTGKPRSLASHIDIPRGAANFKVFTDVVKNMPTEAFHLDTPDGAGAHNYAVRVPKGVIAVISPWNLPLLLMTWKVGPALACGNAVVVKPSEETPSTATLLGEVMNSVGVPDGVYNVVHGFGPESAGQYLTRHAGVDAITFTGETRTGEAIMKEAATGLRDISLECGGKNPALVFADCDLNQAIEGSVRSVFANCGQVCLSTERVYVERPIFDDFVARLKVEAEKLKIGRPEEEGVNMGPLISAEHRDKVQGYYAKAVEDGATLVTGGGAPKKPADDAAGFWIEPTIWTGLPEDSVVVREEIFGPCCHIQPFDSEDEAVAMANDTPYGLACSVWTKDSARMHRLGRRLEAGIQWMNCWFLRDLRTPFGGSKQSGIGREGGVHSLEFYTELRNVCVKL